MPTLLSISKWSETFENADSRKRQRLGFFYAPSGCDSSGYLTLMSEFPQKEALMALGIFMALCQVAATGRKDERGTFIKGDGEPMSMKQVAMLIRCHESALVNAIKILADKRVKWVTCRQSADDLPPICQSSATPIPLNSEDSPIVQGQGQGQGQGEGEGEGEESSASSDAGMSIPQMAELIWAEYPRKKGKKESIPAITRELKTRDFAEFIQTVKDYAESVKGQDMQYVPYGSSYFRGEKFNDELDLPKEKTNGNTLAITNEGGQDRIAGRATSIIKAKDLI